MNKQQPLKLNVTVVSADHLMSSDVNGLADPYVKFTWRGLKYKTEVVRKNLNPVWNSTFVLDFEPSSDPSTLQLSIWDWDRFGTNDAMGIVNVDFSTLQPGVSDGYYNIQSTLGCGAQGRLRLKLEKLGGPAAPPNVPVPTASVQQPQMQPQQLHQQSQQYGQQFSPSGPYSSPPSTSGSPQLSSDPAAQLQVLLPNISKQEIQATLTRFNGDKEKTLNCLLNQQISVVAEQKPQQQFQPNQPSLGNVPNSSNAGLQSSYSPQQGGGFAPVAPPVMISASVAGAIPDPSLVYSGRGRKKALLIGINYFNTQIALKGCIQDAQRMKSVLTRIYGFPDSPDSIIMLTDDNPDWRFKPTKQNILYAMSWLVQGCVPGDVLFFHFSGHGSQKLNLNGTEDDGYDETILPCDAKQAGVIIDDEIHARLVQPLPSGVRLTAVMDCCHSGTGMDLPFTWKSKKYQWKADLIPFYTAGDVQLFSSCADDDVYTDPKGGGFFGSPFGEAGGAMTTAFITAVSGNPYGHSYVSLLGQLRMGMRARGLRQEPQLSSTQAFPINRPFNLTDIVPNRNPTLGRPQQQPQQYDYYQHDYYGGNKKKHKKQKKYKKNKYMGGKHNIAGGPAGLHPLSGILIGGSAGGVLLNQLW